MVGTVILVAKGNVVAVRTHETSVGDSDAVGITRQVGKYGFGACERFFDVNIPFGLGWPFEERIETGAI